MSICVLCVLLFHFNLRSFKKWNAQQHDTHLFPFQSSETAINHLQTVYSMYNILCKMGNPFLDNIHWCMHAVRIDEATKMWKTVFVCHYIWSQSVLNSCDIIEYIGSASESWLQISFWWWWLWLWLCHSNKRTQTSSGRKPT